MPNLKMVQLWRVEIDKNCLDMKVQSPGAMVFVGFDK